MISTKIRFATLLLLVSILGCGAPLPESHEPKQVGLGLAYALTQTGLNLAAYEAGVFLIGGTAASGYLVAGTSETLLTKVLAEVGEYRLQSQWTHAENEVAMSVLSAPTAAEYVQKVVHANVAALTTDERKSRHFLESEDGCHQVHAYIPLENKKSVMVESRSRLLASLLARITCTALHPARFQACRVYPPVAKDGPCRPHVEIRPFSIDIGLPF